MNKQNQKQLNKFSLLWRKFIASWTYRKVISIIIWNLIVILIILITSLVQGQNNNPANITMALFGVSLAVNLLMIISIKTGLYQNLIRPFNLKNKYTKEQLEQKKQKQANNWWLRPIHQSEQNAIASDASITTFVINILLAILGIIIGVIIYYAA
ncbi:hypothetical protein [Mycoplasmopsis agassizii]|uniref:DUF3899 domain-containing protein n=1 Tax=Mycoplasmopsis agassizii TaxID=33922 RepID=A0ABX4H5Z2_9BACT|nr:hypothetical protein [Mycoplasmopsis agassizii]PAF55198.1 hypothetical protein CJF60_00730 [Mycoplasmopsis agassizii]SMC19874.1 hypothetical protein SAMN02745179_00968 [Mycoplasmopsis agassizii]